MFLLHRSVWIQVSDKFVVYSLIVHTQIIAGPMRPEFTAGAEHAVNRALRVCVARPIAVSVHMERTTYTFIQAPHLLARAELHRQTADMFIQWFNVVEMRDLVEDFD